MIVYPAVDVKDGKCVRLKKGRADEVTVFSANPVEAALHWEERGAKRLHLVDLDGAFAGEPVNLPLIQRMCAALSIPIQMGGGIRSLDTAKAYVNAGIERLIIGTLALENPTLFSAIASALPGRVGVSLDTVGERLKTKGWVEDSGRTIFEVLARLSNQGAAFIIHTDIERDGMQSGVNLPLLTELCAKSPLPVIAAGGVATIDDIKALYPLSRGGKLEGAITGRALYEGTLDLTEAMGWIAGQA